MGAFLRHRGGLSRARLTLLVALTAYAGLFLLAYHTKVVPRYDYFGMGDRPIPAWGMALLVAAAVLPASLVPTVLTRPSQLLYWAMYLLVYVPSLFLLFYSNLPRLSYDLAIPVAGTLVASVLVLGLGYRIRPRRIRVLRLAPGPMFLALCAGAALLYGYMLVRFGGIFHWVSFSEIAGQRGVFLDAVTGTFGAYAFAWIVAVVNPVLVAIGGASRRPLLILCGLAGQVLMYGAAASKGVLLSLMVFPVLMWLVYRHRERFGTVMVAGLATLVGLAPFADLVGLPVVGAAITFIVLFRTLAIPGLATAQYAGFFADRPHTLGSHVTGLSSLIHYPYHTTLDYLVGQYYYGQVDMGLNANTWASDGLAGGGLPGVLIATVLCAGVFWLIDSAAEGLDVRFTVVALSYGVANFSNVPLFTNLITGGIALFIVVFALWPRPAVVNEATA